VSQVYEYRKIRVGSTGWEPVAKAVYGTESAQVREVGASIYGMWRGVIGAGSDEGVLMSAWPGLETLAQHGAATLGNIEGVIEHSHFARVTATVRPPDATPPNEPGVYAHRWFSLQEVNWPEFLQLSEMRIWPYIEGFDCRIVGLWRNVDVDPPAARALLITRYPSMTVWDQTRTAIEEPPPGASPSLYSSARSAILRRAELTEWTIVRIFRLVGAA